jgi:hypothetical protein
MEKARCRLFVLLAAAVLSSCDNYRGRNDRVHVILVGDSTMARVTGYGDALCARFDAPTKCENLAAQRSQFEVYRAEGLWDEALAHGASRPIALSC